MSADPVAEVLARVLGEHDGMSIGLGTPRQFTRNGGWSMACSGCDAVMGDQGDEDEAWRNHEAHVATEQAAALREAGLIPEARRLVEWRLEVGPIGYVESFDEQGIKAMAAWRGGSVFRRVRTTYASDRYADRVTEWEAVE